MDESQKTNLDDSTLLVTLTAGQLRALMRQEIQAAPNGNGYLTMLTAAQLAKKLQVNKATVYEWVKAKSIPYYQAGRFIRFNLQEVLDSQRKKPQLSP